MKVLIIATDVFEHVGGGETVYQKIMTHAPAIDFYYFVSDMCKNGERPANTHPVLLKPVRKLKALMPPPFPSYQLEALADADRYAYSVEGMEFDLVDIPDYYSFGSYLRSAFAYNRVKVGRVVLAMHGNLSTSIRFGWDRHDAEHIRARETEQFAQADFVYSISEAYMQEWIQRVPRKINYINPLDFVTFHRASYRPQPDQQVNVYCIGRTERIKGNDLFIELMRWINPELYGECAHIGNVTYLENGVSSSYHLRNLAIHRDMDQIQYFHAVSKAKLNHLYHSKALVIIPSRYDTLNLVALEALFSGCPVAVSDRAGVCSFLDKYYPQLPYVKIRFEQMAESIQEISFVLSEYDAYRMKLLEELERYPVNTNLEQDIYKLYQHALEEQRNRNSLKIAYQLKTENVSFHLKQAAIKLHVVSLCRKYRNVFYFRQRFKDYLLKSIPANDARLIQAISSVKNLLQEYKHVADLPESSAGQISSKTDAVYGLADRRILRINAYDEITRLQYKKQEELISRTFLWRKMRLAGTWNSREEKSLERMLSRQGFSSIVPAAACLYGGSSDRDVYQYLHRERKRLMQLKVPEASCIVEDRRTGHAEVSVIVSLYHAADQLDYFISMLKKQTLMQTGELEIIFVDSHSPTNEKEIIDMHAGTFSYLYIRTDCRETIQGAWNRGIGYARGKYLTFLGVDEMMYPEALELLWQELESDPQTDWVVGDSIVQNVDQNGTFVSEEMMYQREGLRKPLVYLETCYLTYVGGLYRKDVHTRFGYYDADYKGAGDTEFKNRILPYIKIRHIQRTLGIFLNYPQERVTASPMAEIEDLKAYYIFKSVGGAAYTYEHCTLAEIEEALLLAIGYRKSYRQQISTDIEYARNIARYGAARNRRQKTGHTLADQLLPELEQLLVLYRSFEYVPYPIKPGILMRRLIHNCQRIRQIEKRVQSIVGDRARISFEIFHDNRWEQHVYLWRGKEMNES